MADDGKQILDENISKMDQLKDRVDDLNNAGLKQLLNDAIDLHKTVLKQVDALKQVRNLTKNIFEEEEKRKALADKEEKLLKDQNNILNNLNNQALVYTTQIKEGFDARRKQAEQLTKIVQAEETLERLQELKNLGQSLTAIQQQEEAKAINDKINAEQQILKFKQDEQNLSKLLEKGAIDNLQNLTNSEKSQIKKYLNLVKENEEFKVYLKNHGIDLEIWKKELEAQRESMSVLQLTNQWFENKLKKLKEIKSISDTLDWGKKQLDGIGISFSAILTNVLNYGKVITDAAKGLGISVDGVRELTKGYSDVAMEATKYNEAAETIFLTNKNQLAAQQEINKTLGTSGLITAQARIDQVTLTKQMGLQADEAANLYKIGLLNKRSAKDVAEATAQQVINLRQQTKINLDLKQVLIDVGKVSGQIAAQYKNNPELLAKAVVQAKALGLTLEQTAAIGDKLLDFPGSIESELKAELLTGKALNLEQARYLALMGDSAGAAKELMNNVGGLSEFQKLNVLQQKALAEAVGMTADQLADSLKQQELLKGSGFASDQAFKEAIANADTEEEKAKLIAQIKQSDNAKQLLQQYEQISAQERFNQTVEKLKEMMSEFVDKYLGKFLEMLSKAASYATTLKVLFYGISAIIAGNMIKGIAGFVSALTKSIAPAVSLAMANTASASALTLGVGAVAIIGGLLAVASALSSATGENINVSGTSGGTTGGVDTSGGGINVPKESSKPYVIEAKLNTNVNLGGSQLATVTTKQSLYSSATYDT